MTLWIKPGLRIHDRYEIAELVGTGGFGAVYHGRDHNLNREVAIKRLMLEKDASDGISWTELERLRRDNLLVEARKIVSVQHPNIVLVYDVLEVEDEALIVMEYLPGGTLHDRLRQHCRQKTWLTASESITLIRSILLGLEAAHTTQAQPIIHQDLKPKNILFDQAGVSKISDFGIATVGIVAPIQTAERPFRSHPGSAGFMSPEQLKGLTLDVRSDLFNVGLIACILLAGAHPLTDPRFLFSYEELLEQPYRALADLNWGELPKEVVQFIERLTATRPDDRIQSAGDALAELDIVESQYRTRIMQRALAYHDELLISAKPPSLNVMELAIGISECKKSNFYTQGAFLYERSGVDFETLPDKIRLQLEADYRICKRKSLESRNPA